MEDLIEKVDMVRDQLKDILPYFTNEPYNLTLAVLNGKVLFRLTLNGVEYKEKLFSGDSIDEIKAYLFDVLDGAANL